MSEEAKNKIRSLKRNWDTDQDDKFGEDFTSPCIENSTLYRRLSGDFSSHVIKVLKTSTVKNLIDTKENQCRIKILTHPSLTEEDKTTLENVLKQGRDTKDLLDKIAERSVKKYLYKNEPHLDRQTRLDIFAQLIAKKNILIKFAFSKNPRSLFHKKLGIFDFPWGDKLYHIGGENFSVGGLEINNEHFNTFQSWHERDLAVIETNEKLFDKAWEDKSTKYITRELNQETLDKIIARAPPKFKKEFKVKVIRKNQEPDLEVIKYDEKKDPYLTVTPKWDFQKDAREIFINKKKGVLQMATGTGKTRTALGIVSELLNKKLINKIIIQMYGGSLQKQWFDEINEEWLDSRRSKEQIRILKAYEQPSLIDQFVGNYNNKESIDLIIVSKNKLSRLLSGIRDFEKEKCIIIHDEVHDLFSKGNVNEIKGLQKDIQYRLGLSATAEFDEEVSEEHKLRNQNLYNEVGPIIYNFEIEHAIERGVLVEFNFIHLNYELNRKEKERKAKLIGALNSEHVGKAEKEMLSIQAARINKLALNKIDVLEDFIITHKNLLNKCFMFTLTMEYGNLVLEKVLPHQFDVKTYYEEGADMKNLKKFANGELECIISCKSLSQGINLKRLENVFFFSIEGKRELIQKMGRVLRTDLKDNPNKKATVVDFFESQQMDNQRGADFLRYQELDKLSKIKLNKKYAN